MGSYTEGDASPLLEQRHENWPVMLRLSVAVIVVTGDRRLLGAAVVSAQHRAFNFAPRTICQSGCCGDPGRPITPSHSPPQWPSARLKLAHAELW